MNGVKPKRVLFGNFSKHTTFDSQNYLREQPLGHLKYPKSDDGSYDSEIRRHVQNKRMANNDPDLIMNNDIIQIMESKENG